MNAREHAACIATSDGQTAAQIARLLGIPARQVETLRRRDDFRTEVARLNEQGIGPRERFTLLSYSIDAKVSLDAAAKLARLQVEEPPPAEPGMSREKRRALIYTAGRQGFSQGYGVGYREALIDTVVKLGMWDTLTPEDRAAWIERERAKWPPEDAEVDLERREIDC
jgi:DNA-binding CsgD family transcriptional regulator